MPEDHGVQPPTLLSRRHAIIGGVLAGTAAIGFARQPAEHAPRIARAQFDAWIPRTVRDWSVIGSSGVLLPPPDALSDRLYDNLATRVYESSSDPSVMLLLAYNNLQSGVVQVHRPEICYPVGGFTLSPTREVPLAVANGTIPASFFTAVGPGRTEQVLYFTRLGQAYPRTWAQQRWAVAKANLDERIPDGLLIRASLLGGSASEALLVLTTFLKSFIAAAPRPLHNLLVR